MVSLRSHLNPDGDITLGTIPDQTTDALADASLDSYDHMARCSKWLTFQRADDDAASQQEACLVPVDGGGWLVLFLDKNERIAIRVLGDDGIEQDATGRWRAMLAQLQTRMSRATLDALPDESTRASISSLDDVDADTAELFRMRLAMRENSARFTQQSFGDRDVYLTTRWLTDWADNMAGLEAYLGDVEARYGEAASSRYQKSYETGEALLREAASAYENDQKDEYRQAMGKVYRASCQSCHQTPAEQGGEETIYLNLREAIHQEGARRDLFIVGVDTLSVPGQERRSQQVADAARLAILIWNDQ
ncbi:MAG: hypothetical protein ACYTF7_11440 [Planctomycetota bacterium]|jgi:hypothetical protein